LKQKRRGTGSTNAKEREEKREKLLRVIDFHKEDKGSLRAIKKCCCEASRFHFQTEKEEEKKLKKGEKRGVGEKSGASIKAETTVSEKKQEKGSLVKKAELAVCVRAGASRGKKRNECGIPGRKGRKGKKRDTEFRTRNRFGH